MTVSLSYVQGTGSAVRKADAGDFTNWRSISMPASGAWRFVASNGHRTVISARTFVTVDALAYSHDGGETWNLANIDEISTTIELAAKLGPRFVVADRGGNVYISGNASDWYKHSYTGSSHFIALEGNAAAAYRAATDTSIIMTNGAGPLAGRMTYRRAQGAAWAASWIEVLDLNAATINEMHILDDKFVAVGNKVFYSGDDGVTWNSDGVSYGFLASWLSIDGTKIYAIQSVPGFSIYESSDGITWADTGEDSPYEPLNRKGREKYVLTEADGLLILLRPPNFFKELPQTTDNGINWTAHNQSNFEESICLVDTPAESIEADDPTDENGDTEIPDMDSGTDWELCIQPSAECPVECIAIEFPPFGAMAITDADGSVDLTLVSGDYDLSAQPFGCETAIVEQISPS